MAETKKKEEEELILQLNPKVKKIFSQIQNSNFTLTLIHFTLSFLILEKLNHDKI